MVVHRYLSQGHDRAPLLATLGRMLLREDAEFHSYQMYEAGLALERELRATPSGGRQPRTDRRHALPCRTRANVARHVADGSHCHAAAARRIGLRGSGGRTGRGRLAFIKQSRSQLAGRTSPPVLFSVLVNVVAGVPARLRRAHAGNSFNSDRQAKPSRFALAGASGRRAGTPATTALMTVTI